MIDYSKGRYIVKTPDGGYFARIDGDEFARNGLSIFFRIDGDEFYEAGGRFIGYIKDGAVRTPSGETKFTIEAE
jgi:hypothetical protein